MSGTDRDLGAPIAPDSPLARALGDYPVPGLPAGFADRVLAAAEARAAPAPAPLAPPLPPLRRAPHRGRGWRLGRGIAIGVASFGVLASAAAATGLLERFDIAVPSPKAVWASLTGDGDGAVAAAPAARAAPAAGSPAAAVTVAAAAPVEIVGPVDTPEELGEVFRRIEAVREGRFAARQERIDQRIERAIARRREAGLQLPTAEEEAALRERIAAAEARRAAIAAERIAARREELAGRVEQGEALTREDIIRPLREDAHALAQRDAQLRQLRRLPPEERREALRRMPPAERRALVEALRARRGAGAGAGSGAAAGPGTPAVPTPEPTPAAPSAAPPAE